jgi:hypothetical protein
MNQYQKSFPEDIHKSTFLRLGLGMEVVHIHLQLSGSSFTGK